MIHQYSKGLEKDFFGEMTESTKNRMTFDLRRIGEKISKDDVKIETKSDPKYPRMAGKSDIGYKKITIFPMAFTFPIYPTSERIYDFAPESDNSSILMIVAHELSHAFAEERDAYDSSGKLIYGKQSKNPSDALGYLIEKYYFDNKSKFTTTEF